MLSELLSNSRTVGQSVVMEQGMFATIWKKKSEYPLRKDLKEHGQPANSNARRCSTKEDMDLNRINSQRATNLSEYLDTAFQTKYL